MADQADIAWHFTGDTLRDGSPIPVIGHTLVFSGEIEMCHSGYHWSRTPWQALEFAPGNLLHKVQVGGKIIEDTNKGVSSERTILATIDATQLLRRFAADQALSVAHLWLMPDVVREYLTGLDESKRAAAWAAARAAAWAAAWATWEAAREAAWEAARDAARDGAWAAAKAAARAAARDATWEAARAAAWAGARDAARDAAWAAARAAAWDAAATDFNRRVFAAFEMETV